MAFAGGCGVARKAFRSGRFLSGFNALRKSAAGPTSTLAILNVLGHSGDMVYFLFDHVCWVAKLGLLDAKHGAAASYISAFGECVEYVAFVLADLLGLAQERHEERQLLARLCSEHQQPRLPPAATSAAELQESGSESAACWTAARPRQRLPSNTSLVAGPLSLSSSRPSPTATAAKAAVPSHEDSLQKSEALQAMVLRIRTARTMRFMSIAANTADLIIALAEVEPNPVCCHPLAYGISGLVSAWAGWYRNWPAAT
eukprot:SM000024S07773  [mRNA]  locus=s24:397269:398200:+ [translate_table: standard]